jgi:hypothetical protein
MSAPILHNSVPLIHTAMATILAEVDAIAKTRTNAGQGFRFRSVDDVYRELHKVFAKHHVYMAPMVLDQRHEERTTSKGSAQMWSVVRMQYTFYATDGSSVSASTLGEAVDPGDKSCGKAQSYAHKICLLQMFCIPAEANEDPDAYSPRLGARSRPQRPGQGADGVTEGLSAVEKYSGTDDQKRELAKLVKAQSPNADKALLKQISDTCQNVPMGKLPQAVASALAGGPDGTRGAEA